MATLIQIQAKVARFQAQAHALIANQSSSAIETVRDLMAKHDLSIADIDSQAGGKKRGPKPGVKTAAAKKVSEVQYQDPEPGATWSGRGRAPGWLVGVTDRKRLLIDGGPLLPQRKGRALKIATRKGAASGRSGTKVDCCRQEGIGEEVSGRQ